MEHFSMEKWIDFARNVVGAQERAAMEDHLKDGCERCSQSLSMWTRVHGIARHDHKFEPPESAVRSMKGTFGIRGPRKAHGGARAIVELLFDSARNPLPAGVRSDAASARQLLFGIADYRIDVRMEPKIDSDKVALTGQVLQTRDQGDGLGAIPVALVKGKKVVAEAVTSQFGEFALDCDLDGHFHLRVKLPSEELELPLLEPALNTKASGSQVKDSKEIRKARRRSKKSTRGRV
jgi:hypothetical protein